MDIIELNTILVSKELKSLYCITKSIIKHKDSSIISMGFNNYLTLLTIEIVNYTNDKYNKKIAYNFKKRLNEIRARIKEYNVDSDVLLNRIEELNKSSLKYYSKDIPKISKAIFKKLINNIGIFKYNNKIISNTFLISKDLKPIIYTNNRIKKERIIESSKTIGELLNYLIIIYFNQHFDATKISLQYPIILEDYNVIENNDLFLEKKSNNISLFLLDILSITNYCIEIIDNFEICNELKYRIFYLAFYRTYHNLKNFTQNNNNYCKIESLLKKYSVLDNRDFRNAMFHYDITRKIGINEIIIDQMYYGIIFKYLKIDDESYKNFLNNYLLETSKIISQTILINNQ